MSSTNDEQDAEASTSNGPLRRREFQRVPSATSLVPPTSDQGLTANDLLAHEALLESQAREAIPFSFSLASCTYTKGYIRQPLFACRNCGGGAVCAGCSIGCHAEHDLIELFAKRHSRCDCGCPSLQRTEESKQQQLKPCSLRQTPLNFAPENDENTYGKNHDGHFCYCEKGYTYNPHEEEETMFQCVVCEEWLHETCTSLRPRAAKNTASKENEEDSGPPPLISHEAFDTVICDACVRKYPILHHYVGVRHWGACLQVDGEWDGQSVLVAEHEYGPTRYVVSGLPVNEEYGQDGNPVATKRGLSPIAESDDGQGGDGPSASKRVKVDAEGEVEIKAGAGDAGETAPNSGIEANAVQTNGASTSASKVEPRTGPSVLQTRSTPPTATDTKTETVDPSASNQTQSPTANTSCRLPAVHPLVKHLLSVPAPTVTPHPNNPENLQRRTHRLDIFLNEGNPDGSEGDAYRREICRCSSCLAQFTSLPFLLEPEYTYSPPASAHGGDDQDETASNSSHSTTYDRGLEALNRLPRAQTLEAMEGYGRLRSALFEHLRPFAQSGKAVDEESIRAFFEEQRRRDREGR